MLVVHSAGPLHRLKRMLMMHLNLMSWGIAATTTLAVIARPFKLPEAIWAVAGAVLLVVCGLLPAGMALQAVGKGSDVYLFLFGMMLLSELGRQEGLFDWVAVQAVNHAQGSPRKLFLLVYLSGIVVTTFLSNDAAAVVLTPAVYAAAKKARTAPLPLLYACAFIANAASFVLPISNPANIVLYGNHTPALLPWLARFSLPAVLAIGATYFLLRWSQRKELVGVCEAHVDQVPLSASGKIALLGISVTAAALLLVSAFDLQLGLPTALMGVLTVAVVLLKRRGSCWPLIKDISWSIMPLVAGLFVLVQMLDYTGVIGALSEALRDAVLRGASMTAFYCGVLIALGSNLINNLPAGLIASATIAQAHAPEKVIDALLIGVDLGPNLSVTGSLATILWLNVLRREGEHVGFWTFLKVGAVVMLPAMLLAAVARIAMG